MRRYVVVGAGAIGGTIGGRLHQSGHDVVLVARGAHGATVRSDGLVLRDPDGEARLRIPCVERPAELEWNGDETVIVATKVHHSERALRDLASAAPPDVAIVCATNGLDAERQALRLFPRVYAATVVIPAAHLRPGIVDCHSAPVAGYVDVGRYPSGIDEDATAVAADVDRAGISSRADADIMRSKHHKLLVNVGNVLTAALADAQASRARALRRAARNEAAACLRAAGLHWASDDDEQARRRDSGVSVRPVGGAPRSGGSTWQSIARGLDETEADFLNGEVVLLGRLWGVATPVNVALQGLAREMAMSGSPPGSIDIASIEARIHAPYAMPTRSSMRESTQMRRNARA